MKFHEGFEDEDTVWLVIEYVSGGDLLDFVINKGGLSEFNHPGRIRRKANQTVQQVNTKHQMLLYKFAKRCHTYINKAWRIVTLSQK